jgi:hypothetical protein
MPSPQSRRPKGMADKFSPAFRAKVFSFLAECDGNKTKTAKHFKIPRMAVYRLIERYPDEVQEQKEVVRDSILEQAIEDRELAMNVLRASLNNTMLMLRSPNMASRVRPSDIARCMDMLDKIIRLEGVSDAGQATEDTREDEKEISRKIDAFIESESAKDS